MINPLILHIKVCNSITCPKCNLLLLMLKQSGQFISIAYQWNILNRLTMINYYHTSFYLVKRNNFPHLKHFLFLDS